MGKPITFRIPQAAVGDYCTVYDDAEKMETVLDQEITEIDVTGDSNDRLRTVGVDDNIRIRMLTREIAHILFNNEVSADVAVNTSTELYRAINGAFHATNALGSKITHA